jgi:AAHS family 4-hydroxybenzoate transporter-like MFS transporter
MVAAYVQALRGSHRNVRLLLTNSALLGFAIDGGIYSVILNLYILRLNFGPEFVGQANSLANLVFAFGSMAAGWLGTRFGSRRIMILGLAVTGTGALAVPMTNTLPPLWHAPWILISFTIAYSGLSLYYVNSGPYLLKATREDARGNVFAFQSAVNSVASFAGGLFGGLMPALFAGMLGVTMLQPGPYGIPLFLVGIIVLVALGVVLQTRDDEEDQPLEIKAEAGGAPSVTSANGLIAFMAGVRFLQVAGIGVAMTFFNVYMDSGLGMATAQIGFIAATARLVAVPVALLGPSLSRRLGFGATAVFASTMAGLSMLPIAFGGSAAVAGLGFVGVMSFTSMRYPAFYVFMMERTPERLRAIMNGANEMAAGLSFAAVSLVAGFVIVQVGYGAAFAMGAALTLLGTAVLGVYVYWGRKK